MVKVRARGKSWQYDILFRWPDGTRFRERANAPVSSKSAAVRWAAAREASLLAGGRDAHAGKAAPSGKVPTLAAWWPRVLADHYRANRKKASTIDAAESIYRLHLALSLGPKPLDQITTAEVAALKGRLSEHARKTVNNILTVLSRALRCAVEWGVLPAMPCKVGFFKIDNERIVFLERDDYRKLVAATWCHESRALVLLAGSAGLRRGEVIALRWCDVDFARGQLDVRVNLWRRVEDSTKGGKGRIVPLTPELADALRALRKGRRVLAVDGDARVLPGLTPRRVRNWLARAERRAGLAVGTARAVRDGASGGIHRLRHTFCSHLAMAGVPAMAIKELAGHADLATTQRYMHLSPSNRSAAVAALAAYHATTG